MQIQLALNIRGMCILAEPRISTNICRFCLYTQPMPYNPTQLSESCKGLHFKYLSHIYFIIRLIECITVKIIARSGWIVFFKKTLLSKKYCDYSSSFRHYVFTQILHCSHAVLDCASMKADILHFQTCPDQLTSLEQASGIAEPVLP
ncbi:hypothetical protein T10_12931 [Trichinella papuae]|uniref:Uncharacterized protein n=1 Tax=Trichinella papuae TaxID=268474 RepID=A0A0V1MNA6_9BILA|nr:hypothetical protein T10_12931 [Trichinella papuae]